MSIFASLLRGVYKLSGAKKAFKLPEDEIAKVIEGALRNDNGKRLPLPYRETKRKACRACDSVFLRRRNGDWS